MPGASSRSDGFEIPRSTQARGGHAAAIGRGAEEEPAFRLAPSYPSEERISDMALGGGKRTMPGLVGRIHPVRMSSKRIAKSLVLYPKEQLLEPDLQACEVRRVAETDVESRANGVDEADAAFAAGLDHSADLGRLVGRVILAPAARCFRSSLGAYR